MPQSMASSGVWHFIFTHLWNYVQYMLFKFFKIFTVQRFNEGVWGHYNVLEINLPEHTTRKMLQN